MTRNDTPQGNKPAGKRNDAGLLQTIYFHHGCRTQSSYVWIFVSTYVASVVLRRRRIGRSYPGEAETMGGKPAVMGSTPAFIYPPDSVSTINRDHPWSRLRPDSCGRSCAAGARRSLRMYKKLHTYDDCVLHVDTTLYHDNQLVLS